MFEPLVEAAKWLYSLVPQRFHLRRPQFHFITVHYMYMVGMTIIISIMLYPAGVLSYTDALFFAAGTATQSGLNTVNVNDLNTYQQVVIMLLCCICTPIFINMVVVFVRLYWFEKRFAHIVEEARSQRRTRSRSMTSRSRSQMRGSLTGPKDEDGGDPDRDASRLEMGVNGRMITVLHRTTKPNGMTGVNAAQKNAEKEFLEKLGLETNAESITPTPEQSSTESSNRPSKDRDNVPATQDVERTDETEEDAVPRDRDVSPEAESQVQVQGSWSDHRAAEPPSGTEEDAGRVQRPSTADAREPAVHRGITFADEVQANGHHHGSPLLARVPANRSVSGNIEFIQRQQQNAKQGGALRIPDPRAFDRGEVPQQLGEEETSHRPGTIHSLYHTQSNLTRHKTNRSDAASDHFGPPRRGITIDEPEHHPGHRTDGASENEPDGPSSRLDKILGGFSNSRFGRTMSFGGEGNRSMARTFSSITSARTRDTFVDPSPYLSWQATTGRNSSFFGLTQQQREELGGIEYRALKRLAFILLGYFFGFHILGMMILLPWILYTQPWEGVVVADGQSAAWWGVFTPASMFNDLGFTLTPDSMESFQSAVLPLLFGSFLIVIGNTGFPCMLRFIIWSLSKMVPRGGPMWEELRFLLDHPRRCFTLLFPSAATWWLFWILVLLNGIDLLFFIILDLDDPTVTSLAPGLRVLNGWFQAVSTRTAGFACVDLADLHPAIQVSYLIMMYISVFPIAISVRRTNVYEEKSLGIFPGEEAPATGDALEDDEDPSYVGQHLRRQLSFDLWFIFLGFFIIAIVEGDRLADPSQYGISLFAVLFEIVSAYGTVGLSLGYTGIDESLSAEFRVLSKLVIIAMMIRGRHRGLPYALDRAILLPHDKLQSASDEKRRRHEQGQHHHHHHHDKPRAATPAPPRRATVANDGDDDDHHVFPRHSYFYHDDEHGDHDDVPHRPDTASHPPPDEPPSPTSPSSRSQALPRPASGATRDMRRRSLTRVLVGGLSAGPTWAKRD